MKKRGTCQYKKLFNTKNLMRVSTFMLLPAIIFDNISWLPKLAGILLIISSVLAIMELHKDYKGKKLFILYLLGILLIILSFYIIID